MTQDAVLCLDSVVQLDQLPRLFAKRKTIETILSLPLHLKPSFGIRFAFAFGAAASRLVHLYITSVPEFICWDGT